eukprot:2614722-Rhodomonas_salina.1
MPSLPSQPWLTRSVRGGRLDGTATFRQAQDPTDILNGWSSNIAELLVKTDPDRQTDTDGHTYRHTDRHKYRHIQTHSDILNG